MKVFVNGRGKLCGWEGTERVVGESLRRESRATRQRPPAERKKFAINDDDDDDDL